MKFLMDSTCATSGIDNFAIRLSISDGGGLIDGAAVGDGFLRCRETGFAVGVRVVDLRLSINFLTVSVIFGGGGIAGDDCGESGLATNDGVEIFGVSDFLSGFIFDCPRDTFGTRRTGAVVGISGRLRFSASSRLGAGRVLSGVVLGKDFLNGVTSLNDGIAGAGFTAGRTFGVGLKAC